MQIGVVVLFEYRSCAMQTREVYLGTKPLGAYRMVSKVVVLSMRYLARIGIQPQGPGIDILIISLTDRQGSVELHWTNNMCGGYFSWNSAGYEIMDLVHPQGSRFDSAGDSWFSRDRVNEKRTVVRPSEKFRSVGLYQRAMYWGQPKGIKTRKHFKSGGEICNAETIEYVILQDCRFL
jgi:hypothetical protein